MTRHQPPQPYYFAQPALGTGHQRYHVGKWQGDVFVVTRITISRPDGTEIARPLRVRTAPAPAPQPDTTPAPRRLWDASISQPLSNRSRK